MLGLTHFKFPCNIAFALLREPHGVFCGGSSENSSLGEFGDAIQFLELPEEPVPVHEFPQQKHVRFRFGYIYIVPRLRFSCRLVLVFELSTMTTIDRTG